MKKYISHKQVKAEPMSYNEALKLNLINTDNETPSENDGYKVVYDSGYTSWSPKTVFENGYNELPESISDQLKVEHEELVARVKRLTIFIKNGATTNERYNNMLAEQAQHMEKYILSLSGRIDMLSSNDDIALAF